MLAIFISLFTDRVMRNIVFTMSAGGGGGERSVSWIVDFNTGSLGHLMIIYTIFIRQIISTNEGENNVT